jgi:hypothetical protein
MPTHIKITGIIWLLLTSGIWVFAQQQGALEINVDTAVEYAFKNNLSVKSAQMDLDDKRFARDSSWNQFVPSVYRGRAFTPERGAGFRP